MPDIPWLSFLWVVAKIYLVVVVIFWFRGSFPRLRIDQLMSFGWKVLIPLSFVNLLITAIYLFYGWPAWTSTIMSVIATFGTGFVIYRRVVTPAKQTVQERLAQARAYRSVEA
jgi:hypothetical protein